MDLAFSSLVPQARFAACSKSTGRTLTTGKVESTKPAYKCKQSS
jgi:hypothetical protein